MTISMPCDLDQKDNVLRQWTSAVSPGVMAQGQTTFSIANESFIVGRAVLHAAGINGLRSGIVYDVTATEATEGFMGLRAHRVKNISLAAR
jgi:hypothetical protein